MTERLILLHLSDIHFRKSSSTPYDLESDLRNELERDAGRFVEEVGNPACILVSGDIAFSGNRDEYDIARDWLKRICEIVGCNNENVWCVPGNHDVDQSIIKNGPLIDVAHKDLATCEQSNIDSTVNKYMNNEQAGQLLLSSIKEYNNFARAYGCEISPEQLTWRYDYPLNDGSVLRLIGVTSTLISSHRDNEGAVTDTRKMVISRYQIPQSEEGVQNLILCHHPFDWWRDEETVQALMLERSTAFLSGHKHVQRLIPIAGKLHLSAGAVHPERQEDGWKPRYNWLALHVETEEDSRMLEIEIYPRLWNDDRGNFAPDYNSCDGQKSRLFRIRLEHWEFSGQASKQEVNEHSVDLENYPQDTLKKVGENAGMNPYRTLAFRFYDLPFVNRMDVSYQLNLIRNEDEGMSESDIFKNVFQRAKEEDKIDQLWDRVESKHGDGKYKENPFRGDAR